MRKRMDQLSRNLLFVLFLLSVVSHAEYVSAQHEFNGSYQGRNLSYLAFPIGGIGAGMYCLEGNGSINHLSIRHTLAENFAPFSFAAICVLGDTPENNVARLLEGPVADWKYFGRDDGNGGVSGTTYGFPRFRECSFQCRFPFGIVDLKDDAVPVNVQITGWSPFTPGDADSSSKPFGALEYRFTNKTNQTQKMIFSYNTKNFMGWEGSIGSLENGIVLYEKSGNGKEKGPAFAFCLAGHENGEPLHPTIDHCWFRGGWVDPITLTWDNIEQGRMIDNPPVEGNSPGASLSVPLELKAGETRTIRLLTSWYVPSSNIRVTPYDGPAFEEGPTEGTAQGQKPVTGFLGKNLVNSYKQGGDRRVGSLTSPPIRLDKKYIHFLIGGGKECPIKLMQERKTLRFSTGEDSEILEWASWDVSEFSGQEAVIRIVDEEIGIWGHINIDHIIMSNEPIDQLRTGKENEIVADPLRVRLVADFEGETFGDWVHETESMFSGLTNLPGMPSGCPEGTTWCPEGKIPETYVPWYATQFNTIFDVVNEWKARYDELKQRSELFTNTFYDSTLPPVVLEAAAANLTILKSPTTFRQFDGRLWLWEGCFNGSGACPGSCTHVWNYAQATAHLFPELERSLRDTECFFMTDDTGRQTFRALLPIRPGGVEYDTIDGQLGAIVKLYRDWRVSGDREWLKKLWPRTKLSLDYMIDRYDPRSTGLPEEEHQNTYDIHYFGPNGHCGSFYIAGLYAAIQIGKEFGEDVSRYEMLLDKGKQRMIKELYNGEFFIQLVRKEGLNFNFRPVEYANQSRGYRDLSERINEQGPKYQYGPGCLSDGILGMWLLKVCGIDEELLPHDMIDSHISAVYKYNFKTDLSQHANPQRPGFGMGNESGLLVCSWPNGGKPLLPFVYSLEVWTGIEYQVASHLMMLGHVKEGLDIVQSVRKRYEGIRRNPYNEVECGGWYGRALSSFALFQGLTGVRYDAVSQTLYVDSRVGDFRSFLCTNTGYGTVVFKDGKAMIEVTSGQIPVSNIVISQKKFPQ